MPQYVTHASSMHKSSWFHRAIGGIAKLHLMIEWQPFAVRAFNVVLWRIVFLLPVKLKESQGRLSLGFICFAFNWFLEIKARVKVSAWKPWVLRDSVFVRGGAWEAYRQPVWALTRGCQDGVSQSRQCCYGRCDTVFTSSADYRS